MRIDEDIFLSSLCFALEMKSKPDTSSMGEQTAVNICTVIGTHTQLSHTDGVYKSVRLYMPLICHKWFRNQEGKCTYRTTLTLWRRNYFFLISAHPVYKM